jgi:hypothetical protein
MILRRRHLILICLLCPGLTALASTGPGYLASAGPAPLRFFSPPPPAPASADAATSTNHVQTAGPTQPEAMPQPIATPAPAVEPVPAQTPPATDMNAATEPPEPADVISPQMLLKYFNKSTNGTATGIIAPIDLSAPPAQPPSSKATYSN